MMNNEWTIMVGDHVYMPLSGDGILMRSGEKGIYRWLKDWLLGSGWGHIAIFYDFTKRGMALVIESIGRGVLIRAFNASEGRYVCIIRHQDAHLAAQASKRAEHLADNPDSWYAYLTIPVFVIPRLIWYKLTGRKGSFTYRNNNHFICSALFDEAYGNIIPDEWGPALPADFLDVKEFHIHLEGKLTFQRKE